jgi:hypothetical protein
MNKPIHVSLLMAGVLLILCTLASPSTGFSQKNGGCFAASSVPTYQPNAPCLDPNENGVLVLNPPIASHYFISSGERFKIGYSLVGVHALQNTSDADGNGTPDFVEWVAEGAEAAWQMYIEQHNYIDPKYTQGMVITIFLL